MTLAGKQTRDEVTPLDLAAEPAGRRWLCKASPSFFANYYLGLDFANHQDRWYNLFLKHKRLLLLAPRGHGKTEALVRVFAESRICVDRAIRVLVISKTKDEARKRVDQVRRDLESNPKIVSDFGSFSPRVVDTPRHPGRQGSSERWSSTQFYVTGRRSSRDATMESVGIGGAITGGHFDLIILDDPVEIGDAQSQSKRDSAWQWFSSTVKELAEPTTTIVVIGTRKHADDLFGRIISDDDSFEVITDRAIPDDSWLGKGEFRYLTRVGEGGRVVTYGVEVTGERTPVLWPERWTLEKLLLKYHENSVVFMRENQNRMIDDDRTVLKRVYFTGGTTPTAPGLIFPGCYETTGPFSRLLAPGEIMADPLGLDILQAWDLSLVDSKEKAEKSDSDFAVGVTCGFDRKTRRRYLLGVHRDRGLLPSQLQQAIKMEAARFPTRVVVGLEVNAFGKMYELGLRASTDLPIRPHTTTGAKKADPLDGLVKFVGLLENGKWRFPMGDAYSRQVTRLIENEMVGFGVEAHDDCYLALWILECMLKRWEAYLDDEAAVRAQREAEEAGDDWRADGDALRD